MEYVNSSVFNFRIFVKIISEILKINKQKQCAEAFFRNFETFVSVFTKRLA